MRSAVLTHGMMLPGANLYYAQRCTDDCYASGTRCDFVVASWRQSLDASKEVLEVPSELHICYAISGTGVGFGTDRAARPVCGVRY